MLKRYAQIDQNVVTGTREAADAPDPAKQPVPEGRAWVELADDEPYPAPGSTYDPDKGTFAAPPAPPDYGKTVTVRDFMLLFTMQERIAIRAAAKADDQVADWFEVASAQGSGVRLRHPTTVAGLNFLVSKSLLTTQRRDAIMNG